MSRSGRRRIRRSRSGGKNNGSRSKVTSNALTMVVMSGQVLPVYKEVMVLVQLPELAVDHVEVLIAEEVGHLVDVILILE